MKCPIQDQDLGVMFHSFNSGPDIQIRAEGAPEEACPPDAVILLGEADG